MLCFMLIVSSGANAQSTVQELIKEWERAKTYTKEYLDAMPDSAYTFKPTPEMRSFATQMLHLSDANYGFGAAGTGRENPLAPGELEKGFNKSKVQISKMVLDSYDFVINGIQQLNAEQLSENVRLFGAFDMTRAMALQKGFEHQTHHRGQTTVYLRLAGIKPPQEKLF